MKSPADCPQRRGTNHLSPLFWSAPLLAAGCASPTTLPVQSPPAGPALVWVASPHFREAENPPRTPADVTTIVIHTTEGSYDESRPFAENHARVYEGTVRYFQGNDREVSAHFVIGPGGEVTQMVATEDIAYTQTYYNARSIGLECAGWSDRAETWTPELLEALVELTAHLVVKWDVPIEHPPGTAEQGPHQIETKDGPRYDGAGILGHFQIQPWNRTDPGPFFPWEEFIARVRRRAGR